MAWRAQVHLRPRLVLTREKIAAYDRRDEIKQLIFSVLEVLWPSLGTNGI